MGKLTVYKLVREGWMFLDWKEPVHCSLTGPITMSRLSLF